MQQDGWDALGTFLEIVRLEEHVGSIVAGSVLFSRLDDGALPLSLQGAHVYSCIAKQNSLVQGHNDGVVMGVCVFGRGRCMDDKGHQNK